MGWLISYGDTKSETIARRIETQVSEDGQLRWRHPKHCVRGNALWKVCITEKLQGEEWVEFERFIALDLLRKGSEGMGWGYKDMDETSGPCEDSCPISYLDMVPCPDSEWARNWRVRVRARDAATQEVTALIRSMKKGDTLYLKKGCSPQAMTLTSKRPLRGVSGGVVYRISRRLIDPAMTRIHLT
jgi:hypothetical protein